MKILSSKRYGALLKVTVQSTGRLGFSGPTASVLNIRAGRYIRFAQDDDAENSLYLAVMQGVDEDGFKVLESGGYYNLNTRALFDALGLDYKAQTIIFDLKRTGDKDAELGGEAYRMTPRFLPKKAPGQKDEQADEEDL